jgi:chemotaxis protein MotB
MARKKKEEPIMVPDLAIVTFSDMMTLLLTFFVLLFSMSEIRRPRIEMTTRALLRQMGMNPAQSAPVMTFTPSTRIKQPSVRIQGPPGQQPEVVSIIEDQRVKKTLAASALFAPGSKRLEPTGKRLLREYMAPELRGFSNRIEISGYAGPADADAGDLWLLGAERAISVLRFLVDDCGLEERRFRVISGGAFNPVDDTGQGRVEFAMTEYPVTNR